jgi:fermentation-respiration switch protein FrsA (DUF1100 family)
MTKLVLGAALALIGVYLAVAVSLFIFQRRLIYHPGSAPYHTPADAGLDGIAREVRLETPDGVSLVAWQVKPAEGQPTLLYFHGNGGSLIDRADRIRRFARDGLGIFMLAYRGYAGSGGSPTETALVADAQLAYDHLISGGMRPEDIVVYGESLGTGISVQLAASRKVAAVVLDAPYTSIADIGQSLYPFIPVRLFLKDTFASIDYIGQIDAPLLVLHGSNDRTVPVALGRALYQAAAEPKELRILEGAGHSDIYLHGAMPPLRRFLDAHLRQPAGVSR